jgi:hypothetical protein
MVAEIETLGGFFEQYGWEYEGHEGQLLVTGFRGKSGIFRIFVQVADDWVFFAVAPFIPRPSPECRNRLLRFLMRLNYEMSLAKISVDDEGDIVLSVEIWARDLRFEGFAEALDVLSFYADEYHLLLTNLAADPTYALPSACASWDKEVS